MSTTAVTVHIRAVDEASPVLRRLRWAVFLFAYGPALALLCALIVGFVLGLAIGLSIP